MAKKKAETPDFETSFKELETLVSRMESGELSLEESLNEFERGMALSKACQEALQSAELKVRMITEKHKESGQSDA